MGPLTIAGVIVVEVVSITAHEASHGFAADRLGDPTAVQAERLKLNPTPPLDGFPVVRGDLAKREEAARSVISAA